MDTKVWTRTLVSLIERDRCSNSERDTTTFCQVPNSQCRQVGSVGACIHMCWAQGSGLELQSAGHCSPIRIRPRSFTSEYGVQQWLFNCGLW